MYSIVYVYYCVGIGRVPRFAGHFSFPLGRQGNIWVVRDTSAFRRETSGFLSNGRTAGRSDGRSDS